MFVRFSPVTVLASCVLVGGCARLGEPLRRPSVSPAAATTSEILRDLAANDGAIQNFRAAGTFTFVSPELNGAVRGRGQVTFEKPDRLHVFARHRVTGMKVFELTCVGQEFLLEFPTEDLRYYASDREHLGDIPFPVSPTDIAREVFFPEPWGEYGSRDVWAVDHPQSPSETVLLIGPRKRPRRRLVVAGPPWTLAKNELLDKRGTTVAQTMLSSYRELDGIRFPTRLEVEFPREQTRLVFVLRSIQLNVSLPEDVFRIAWPTGFGDRIPN